MVSTQPVLLPVAHSHSSPPHLHCQRTELQSFTARVDRCRSKEVAAAEKEADLIKREEEVRRRELTVNAREEWMQKKEGEFRSAQRVAEHARYVVGPRQLVYTPTLIFGCFVATEPLLHSQDRSLTRLRQHFRFRTVIFMFMSFLLRCCCNHIASRRIISIPIPCFADVL